MLKSIKVKQMTYDSLERLREKRESFSETIDRLVKAYNELSNLLTRKKD